MSPRRDVSATTCTLEQAQQLTQQLLQSLEVSWDLLKEAFERRAWAALGFDSWEAYCGSELRPGLVRLTTALRREAVAELASGEKSMSNRAIAAALGVSHPTVAADRRATGKDLPVADVTTRHRLPPYSSPPGRSPSSASGRNNSGGNDS